LLILLDLKIGKTILSIQIGIGGLDDRTTNATHDFEFGGHIYLTRENLKKRGLSVKVGLRSGKCPPAAGILAHRPRYFSISWATTLKIGSRS
jgi:hypothetical protein